MEPDRIFKGTQWQRSGRIVSFRERWIFEFRNGDLVTYPVGQPNRPSWTTQQQTRGNGDRFVYTENGDLLVQDENGKIIWGLRTSQFAHNHIGIDDNGRLALWDGQNQFVRQINIANSKK